MQTVVSPGFVASRDKAGVESRLWGTDGVLRGRMQQLLHD